MDEVYSRVSRTTKKILYQFMKDNDISILNYHFKHYFQYCVKKNNIHVIPHHFSNHKVEGLTIIDELGTSFSFEQNNPMVRQNFTLCHELGHFILNHEGCFFTETVYNQGEIIEREANIFSAVVLMPDIVLLSKIYYSCDSFYKVQTNLEVSRRALFFRLLDLLRNYYPEKEEQIKRAIEDYTDGQNASIFLLLHDIKEKIVKEFKSYHPSIINKLIQILDDSGFTTSQVFPELLNQENWVVIKEEVPNLKIWVVYNKGKSLAYVWDQDKFTEKEARRKAELQLLFL